MLIVNGPIRHQLKINSGANVLSEGWVANATLGRTIRLIQRNIGGSYPGTTCKATLGWPGKQARMIRSLWPDLNPDDGAGLERNVKEIFDLEPSLVAKLKEVLK